MTISRANIGSQMKGNTMYKKKPVKKMAKGGRVRGDGCAVRGKTKGTMR